jgi:membrane-bound lytic murein transglycosylase B
MRSLAFVLAFWAATAALSRAGEPAQIPAETPAETPAKTTGKTQDLVALAKSEKEKKKKSTTKVITNADVKKAKAKVQEASVAAPADAPAPRKSLAEQYETSYQERLIHEEKLAAARQRVANLERELAAVEQSYYDENDLDRRDTEIVRKFGDVRAKLEEARKELAALAPAAGQSGGQ